MSNKKGSNQGVAIGLIVLLISLAVLWGVAQRFSETTITASDRDLCLKSVLLRAHEKSIKEKIPTLDPSKTLDCKTNNVEVKNKDTEQVKQVLADEMYECYKEFNFGKSEFLSTDDFSIRGNNDNICFICSKISYDISTSNEVRVIPISDFEKYLNTQKTPNEKTYAEEMIQTDNAYIQWNSDQKIIINEKVPTYIVFSAQQNRNDNFQETLINGVGRMVIGSAAGVILAPVAAIIAGVSLPITTVIATAVVVGSSVGLFSYTSSAPDYYPGVLVLSGEEVPNFCDELG